MICCSGLNSCGRSSAPGGRAPPRNEDPGGRVRIAMEQIDVIIIGAGIAGLGAARHLAARGRRVLILEGRNRDRRAHPDGDPGLAPRRLNWARNFLSTAGNPALTAALEGGADGPPTVSVPALAGRRRNVGLGAGNLERIDAALRKIGPRGPRPVRPLATAKPGPDSRGRIGIWWKDLSRVSKARRSIG